MWEPVDRAVEVPRVLKSWMKEQVFADALAFNRRAELPPYKFLTVAGEFAKWAKDNASMLMLDPKLPIKALGFHPSFRVGPQGQLVIELVMQFAQEEPGSTRGDEFGGVAFRGGTTVIASADERVRYVVAKPLPHKGLPTDKLREARERRDRQREFVEQSDLLDPALAWYDDKTYLGRMAKRSSFAAIHRRIKL